MSTALVTGASGFLGAHVATHLLDRGWKVRTVVRTASLSRCRWPARCDVVPGDLRDRAVAAEAARGTDAVFHVAAEYSLARHRGRRLERDNLAMTHAVLAAAVAADAPVVFTSSVATIGLPHDAGVGDEETPLPAGQVVGAYKRSKVQAEREALRAAANGQHVVVVNPTAPMGPGDWRPTPTGRVVRDAAAGRIPAVVDTGLNVVDVRDVAAGHLSALERGASGRRYILGGHNLTLRSIVTIAARAGGHGPPRIRLPHAAAIGIAAVDELVEGALLRGEPRAPLDGALMARKHMWVSSARARRELGFAARSARTAIVDAARWYDGERRVPATAEAVPA